jgi:predicted unusual protein kinase regulating ubiquinone biosynthesis (AarF/ABC1/UbiB family)
VTSTDDQLKRLDTLLQVGLRLARQAPSGRIALARAYAGIDPAWIPRPWGDSLLSELDAAADAAREPIEPKRVEKLLAEAWGAKPSDELDDLDLREPVALTPIAQVHKGVLDGKPVAVKVLRPGLAASVRQDLSLLEGLLAPLNSAFPALDASALVHEIRERVLDELDLENEASTQRRFHRALRSHPFLTVPAPVTRLAHDSVLVSEWVDGVPLWRAPDPDQAAARLLVFALGAASSAGVIHADLHPDDVLVTPDGRLAILDFGATRDIDRARVALAATALDSFTEDDAQALGAAVEQLGWLPGAGAGTALDLIRHTLGELAGTAPAQLDSDGVVAARDRLFDRPDQITELVQSGALAPEDLWPARGLGQLFGSIARVGASGAWVELARTALRDGWDGGA